MPADALRRDSAIEAALIEHHQDFLRLLTHRVGNTETAEEVLQQFYLRAVSRAFDLRQRESVRAWLYRLLSSVLADYARREATRRRQETAYARYQALTREDPLGWWGWRLWRLGASPAPAVPGKTTPCRAAMPSCWRRPIRGNVSSCLGHCARTRHAGRVTAQHYLWPQIIGRILLPRLRLLATRASPDNGSTRVPIEPRESIGLEATSRRKWKRLHGIRDPPREAM